MNDLFVLPSLCIDGLQYILLPLQQLMICGYFDVMITVILCHVTVLIMIYTYSCALLPWSTCHNLHAMLHVPVPKCSTYLTLSVGPYWSPWLRNPMVFHHRNDDSTSLCQRFWDAVLWIDNWKKGILYFCFSIPCFIQPHTVWMGIISGKICWFSELS